MKARRKDNNEIIEVTEFEGLYYEFGENGRIVSDYAAADLDFDVEEAEQTESAVISGWVARDKCGNAFLHSSYPFKGVEEWHNNLSEFYSIPKDSFPSLTWESEPIEVEITIKAKMK